MSAIYPSDLTGSLQLLQHPLTPAPAVNTIEAKIIHASQNTLVFAYQFRGDMARLRIPTPELPEKGDQLWEHTCFEAFIGQPTSRAYREFNFSPSGQWACYDFSHYRTPAQSLLPLTAPSIATRLTEGQLELEATVPVDALIAVNFAQTPLKIALSAVIETADVLCDAHSYWALSHPAGRPDFHHPQGFTLNISLPFESIA